MISLVTVTGADDSIPVSDLITLNLKFDFAEFGILFSPQKQGSDRYPTLAWQTELAKAAESNSIRRLSAHLCGKWVRDIVAGKLTWDSPIAPFISRVQMNMTDDTFMKLDLNQVKELFDARFPNRGLTIILQTKRAFQRADEVMQINSGITDSSTKFAMLYDVSGGRGELPKSWASPPFIHLACGFAGGLNPINLQENLTKLANLIPDDGFHWIDAESGMRDEHNKFITAKADRFFSLASAYIRKV